MIAGTVYSIMKDTGIERLGDVVMNNRKIVSCFLCVCLAVTVAGCSGVEELPSETNPVSEPVEAVENEDSSTEAGIPIESVESKEFIGFSEEYLYKKYGSFVEAYLDILAGNRLVLTNDQLTVFDNRTGEDLGDGKIAVLDIFGDEEPELLCLYAHEEKMTLIDPDDTSMFPLYLRIFTYSKLEGVESVFDSVIYPGGGGEHNYCVYITRDGEPMVFLWSSGVMENGGFWAIVPYQNMENEKNDGFRYSCDLAALCYRAGVEVEFCAQYGEEISKDRFDKVSKEILVNIDQVIFQGAVLGGLGLRLYEDVELWRDITPYEERCMPYEEAILWLEAQMDQ